MKIIHFIDGLGRGGKERRLAELLKHIAGNKSSDVELIVMSGDIQYPEVLDLGIPIHYLIRKSRKDPRILWRLFQLCRRSKPDILHVWDSMTAVYAVPVAGLLGVKLINGMITDSYYNHRFLDFYWVRPKLTFRFSDVVVANSHAGLKAYGVPERKGACIHNGFDPARLQGLADRETIREKLGIATKKVVGMVAGFTERKDYAGFIASAEDILRRREDVTFLAIGDGKTLQECRSAVRAENRGRILFPGLQKNVESIMNILDIGVLTTNVDTHEEGISNSILEYMALGKPVIATDSGGTREIVVDGETGFVIRPKDVGALTARIGQILDNPGLGEEMGRRGRQRVFESFTLDAMAERFMKMYEECMGRR